MKQSDELKTLILQWYRSKTVGEVLDLIEHLFSHQEGFMAIGTDPTEWWQNSQEIINGYRAMAKDDIVDIKVGDLIAYSEGTVGWVADRVVYTIPNGIKIPMRHTFVLHKENDEWKIVHVHYSIGVSN
jgi:hypothetical protein